MSKILVTGSKGVIATTLIPILKAQGHQVFGIDLFHAPGEVGWEHSMADTEFTYSRCDIADYRQLERIFIDQKFDFVYNTAAEFGRWNGEDFYEQLWRTNVIGTKNLIRLQEKYQFKLIHFSSSEVYGDYPDTMFEETMEKVEIKQMNDYAITKWVNEMQIRNSGREHATETVIVRLFNTYGPGEVYHPYRSVNAKFCYHALHGLPITVYKGYSRTSTYIEDACRTLANIVENFKFGAVYNIGSGEHHSIEDMANIIWEYTGADLNLITYEEWEVSTARDKKLTNQRSMDDLGHKNTVTLEEGIKKTIDWMKKYYGK